ncbi:hypothetical protein LWI28_022030 [Acer negundo]|uniref:MULE transposase domain-containing protein n=1 Tax=Acer negundo TaxID=4023 RepID=A0AAD5JVH9_ACENE|nr:hypothetical protein LWI28_022030 [Acer negundo]
MMADSRVVVVAAGDEIKRDRFSGDDLGLEVYVSVVEKVSVEHGHVDFCTDQPIYQSFLHQLAAQFQSAGGSNNVVGYIPTTDHAIETPSVNPLIGENPTINEVMPEPYDEDERTIPDYNPHNDYGLDDFDEDYIGHGESRKGVNDEKTHYDGMESNPSEGGHSGSLQPIFGGPNRDTCEDDAINELKKAIGCPANCIIISDRSPAIKVAMGKEYPEITHGLCGFHMNMNLKNRFKSHVVCNLFYEASRAHRQSEFLEKMQELSSINK